MNEPLFDLWSNGEWFEAHPDKRCGTVQMVSTRFDGHQPAVVGTMDDVLRVLHFDGLPAKQPFRAAPGAAPLPTRKPTAEAMAKALAKTTEADNVRPLPKGAEPVMLSFTDVMSRYSPKVTEAEMRLWVQYMTGRGFDRATIADTGWQAYTKPLSKAELRDMVSTGLAGYDGKEYVPGPIFYSGQIYQKMQDLLQTNSRIVAEIGQQLADGQMERMQAAAPAKLRIVAPPEERLFISPISTFAEQCLVQDLAEETLPEPESLRSVFWSWLMDLQPRDFKHGSNAYDIHNHFMDNKPFRNDETEEEKAEVKRRAHEDAIDLFARFLETGLARSEQSAVEHLWNAEYNGFTEMDGSRVPMAFPINSRFNNGPIDPRPALWEGVRFIRANGSGIIAFDVGVGKTMTAILCMADALYTGGAKRPLVVVPNPTYEKWITETIGRYDDNGNEIVAGVLPRLRNKVNLWYNLGSKHAHLPKEQPPQDGTITFVTYEGMQKMGLSEGRVDEMLKLLTAKLDNGSKNRNAAKKGEKVESKYYGKLVSNTVCDFDTMGFDMIVIDEAHRCKNLIKSVDEKQEEGSKAKTRRYNTAQGGEPTKNAIKAFAFCNHVQQTNGGRNTVLLTATPFTNSPLEIYSMLNMVALKRLEERKMGNAPEFFDNFVNEGTELAVDHANRIQRKPVVKKFQNRVMLQSLIFGNILFKTGEEAEVPRPKKVVLPYLRDGNGVPLPLDRQVNTALPPTPLQKLWLDRISEFAAAKGEKALNTYIGSEISGDYVDENGNILGQALMAISMAQACTLSPYLLNVSTGKEEVEEGSGKAAKRTGTKYLIEERPTAKQFIESSPKLLYCVQCMKSVVAWHKARNERPSGQVLYSNIGASYFPMIKEYLVQYAGYKEKEVALIIGGMDADEKEEIKEAFNKGDILVIIGSASIREGIDLQKRSTVLYNCNLDWNPTDIVQLEGRIWRQNNRFSHVRIVVPMIENSVDPFLFQLLEEKTGRINDIWARANRSNVLNVDELNPEELKLSLLTNPKAIAQAKIDMAVAALKPQLAVVSGLLTDLQNAVGIIKRFNSSINEFRGKLERNKAVVRKFIADQTAMLKNEPPSKQEAIQKRIDKATDAIAGTDGDPYDNKPLYRLHKMAMNLVAEDSWRYRDVLNGQYVSGYSEIRAMDTIIMDERTLDALQRGVLSRAGMSLSDDLQPLIDEYAAEVARLSDEKERLSSTEHLDKEVAEATEQLAARAKNSMSLEGRVAQFESMNHLLGCLMTKPGEEGCPVQMTGTVVNMPKADDDRARRLRLIKVKAAALKLKFLFAKAA